MAEPYQGFIVHAYARSKGKGTHLYFVGRLSDGATFAAVETRYRPGFYIRSSERAGALAYQELSAARWEEAEMRSMDGEPCFRVSWTTQEASKSARQVLEEAGIRTYEADLRSTDQFRLDRQIHGPVAIKGTPRQGRLVDRLFIDPELQPGNWSPLLSLLSLDIETNPQDSTVLAIGLSFHDPWATEPWEGVFFRGRPLNREGIQCFAEESSLLEAFQQQIRALNPDIVTGWNVIDFDFQVLSGRCASHGMALDWGRSEEPAVYLPRSQGRSSRLIIPGRQVWDGVRLVRAAPERYQDYSLETVSEAVLGRGKQIQAEQGENRLEAIQRLYREQPAEFCDYCLQDARLVVEILRKTGLFDLSLRRCELTGVAPDRVWTSIPAFEHLYIESMHQRGLVAPSPGVDALPLEGAPGGGILEPQPGDYDQVLVFDFQSLYPSIIRTLNIDPLSYVPPGQATAMKAGDREGLIRTPNDALFRREPAILPELLERFFRNREEAKRQKDHIASFVYKIIMNSFYGVLGAGGCRFAGSALAGAITSFGQHILAWCKGLLEEEGFRVLYGDTDSLFITQGSEEPAEELAQGLCRLVNRRLADYLQARYGVESQLKLEFEQRYSRFFLPPLRGTGPGAPKGRAKGYAGLRAAAGGSKLNDIISRIEVKGMEAVRRDWTDLAHDFQLEMLALLFQRRPAEAFQEYIRNLLKRLRAGELDRKLVYRKALRKPIAAYTKNRPPHVKAAALLDRKDQRGVIRYLMTLQGPQPEARIEAAIDYDHYVERQLKPLASTFNEALNSKLEAMFEVNPQLWLF